MLIQQFAMSKTTMLCYMRLWPYRTPFLDIVLVNKLYKIETIKVVTSLCYQSESITSLVCCVIPAVVRRDVKPDQKWSLNERVLIKSLSLTIFV